jgi:hypothetical protein
MVTIDTPDATVPTRGSDDSSVVDVASENNHPHNPNGTTVVITDVNNLSVDFGFTKASYAHLGDYFWYDKNGNGIQEAGEDPVIGATVELLDGNGASVKDIHGKSQQLTDDKGKYGFDVAPDKTYQVRFVMPAKDADEGFVFTEPNAGNDHTKDSDVGSNGITAPVTPLAGDNVTTLDAGISCPCASIKGDSIASLGDTGKTLFVLLTLLLGVFFLGRTEARKDF